MRFCTVMPITFCVVADALQYGRALLLIKVRHKLVYIISHHDAEIQLKIVTHLDNMIWCHHGKTNFRQFLGSPTLKPLKTSTFCQHVNYRRLCNNVVNSTSTQVHHRNTLHLVLGKQQKHGQKWVWSLQSEKWSPAEWPWNVTNLFAKALATDINKLDQIKLSEQLQQEPIKTKSVLSLHW